MRATSSPAWASLAPKYPPIPPAPKTAMRIVTSSERQGPTLLFLCSRTPRACAARLVASRPHALVRGFGGCAATHVEGTGQPVHFFPAILLGRPWVVVTVPALVLCARLLGWSREEATTSLVTGPVLIPFGRLHPSLSLPPPTAVLSLFPTTGGGYDTPQRLLPRCWSLGPYTAAPSATRALRRPPGLPPPRRWPRHWRGGALGR